MWCSALCATWSLRSTQPSCCTGKRRLQSRTCGPCIIISSSRSRCSMRGWRTRSSFRRRVWGGKTRSRSACTTSWQEQVLGAEAKVGAAHESLPQNEKQNYVGRGNSPYINKGKGDTLAQKSLESPPPRSYKKRILMGFWRVIGSTRLHNLAAR
eukprot:1141837-Pelagomonas_calceolata.AAC.1